MADLLGMTARARAWRVVVRRVARGALRVVRRREHWLIAMAARARLDLGGAERVWLMTPSALGVTVRERRLADPHLWPLLLRVTARAALIGDELGLVNAMAVDAAAHPRVLRLLISVTLRARPGI
jgi:hypothetical protein